MSPFFIRKWPPNLILRVTHTGNRCPLCDSKLVPDIIDKYNRVPFSLLERKLGPFLVSLDHEMHQIAADFA